MISIEYEIVMPHRWWLRKFWLNGRITDLRIRAMHEANSALLEILVDNSVIIPSFQKLLILLFFTSYIAGILKSLYLVIQCI